MEINYLKKLKESGASCYVEPTKVLESGTDLNNVTEPGVYKLADGVTVSEITNMPANVTQNQFIKLIVEWTGRKEQFQKLISIGYGNTIGEPTTFLRTKFDFAGITTMWSSWVKIPYKNEFETIVINANINKDTFTRDSDNNYIYQITVPTSLNSNMDYFVQCPLSIEQQNYFNGATVSIEWKLTPPEGESNLRIVTTKPITTSFSTKILLKNSGYFKEVS